MEDVAPPSEALAESFSNQVLFARLFRLPEGRLTAVRCEALKIAGGSQRLPITR